MEELGQMIDNGKFQHTEFEKIVYDGNAAASGKLTVKIEEGETDDQTCDTIKANFVKYFSGGRSTSTLAKFFSNEVSQIRDVLRLALRTIMTFGPSSLRNQLNRGLIKDWSHYKTSLLEWKGCKTEQPSIIDARAIVRDAGRMNTTTVESRIIALRERLYPFYKKYKEPFNLSEQPSEGLKFNEREDNYGPHANFLYIMIVVQDIPHDKFCQVLDELAKILNKAADELSIEDFLDNKRFLYQRFNGILCAKEAFMEDEWYAAHYKNPEIAAKNTGTHQRADRIRMNNTGKKQESSKSESDTELRQMRRVIKIDAKITDLAINTGKIPCIIERKKGQKPIIEIGTKTQHERADRVTLEIAHFPARVGLPVRTDKKQTGENRQIWL